MVKIIQLSVSSNSVVALGENGIAYMLYSVVEKLGHEGVWKWAQLPPLPSEEVSEKIAPEYFSRQNF